jgi:putative ABC transport system substrate-binding protein
MNRRTFIAAVGGAAVWPLVARAQQRRIPAIGILGSTTAASTAPTIVAFMQGLKETGFVEYENVALEERWADDQYDRLPEMAADLVRAGVSLIATFGNNLPARAAKAATSTIPIIFRMGADPVALGLVASLGRPGGNITGATDVTPNLVQKRLQLLHDLLPTAKRFGYLVNPNNPADVGGTVSPASDAVRGWGGTVEISYTGAVRDFDAAFRDFAAHGVEAIATGGDALFGSGRGRLVELAAQHAVPMIHYSVLAVRAGGLMSYNARPLPLSRQIGVYAGRILKGEKPADLPVLQPTEFEFVFNLRTARALGLTVPSGLLAIIDEVIE